MLKESSWLGINKFLHKCDRGYFTILGAPGSGKSAILAKYVTENPHVIYYSAQIEGKNQADEFLTSICNQLINQYPHVGATHASPLQTNIIEGSWFLSLLLQKISDSLEPNQPLIIAIDALDAIAPNSQAASSNLFYLPRYLPHQVYFLLTRRPFVRERSRLLIETPSQIFDLEQYPQQNREDVRAYIQHYLTAPELRANLESWLTANHISKQDFCDRLTEKSENNFMYLSQILQAIGVSEAGGQRPTGGRSTASIAQGFYPKPFEFDQLPSSLEAYYQSHWQQMITNRHVSAVGQSPVQASVELAILNILVQEVQPISAEAVAQIIEQDEYEVEEVLETWIEFLQQQQIGGATCYRLYHCSFRNWLGKQLNRPFETLG